MDGIFINDFDRSCGLAHGIEDGQDFLVQRNFGLNTKNQLCYNEHMLADHQVIFKNWLNGSLDCQLFVASPDFGDRINRRGASNFNIEDLNLCLAYVSLKKPDYILIAVPQSAITYLQIEKTVAETYEGIPTNDLIVSKLKEMGYTTQYFVIDPVSYRLPQHKITAFYFSAKKDIFDKPIILPKKSYSRKDSAVWNWLKNIPNLDDKFHHFDFSKRDICEKIQPGSNAKKTKDVSNVSGYNRLRPDRPCVDLGIDFYKTSSSLPSIHPFYDRPLTLREGAVLAGLPQTYVWDTRLKNKDVAKMIHHSVSPIIGNKIRMGLKYALGL